MDFVLYLLFIYMFYKFKFNVNYQYADMVQYLVKIEGKCDLSFDIFIGLIFLSYAETITFELYKNVRCHQQLPCYSSQFSFLKNRILL